MDDDVVQVLEQSEVQLKPTSQLHTASMTSFDVTMEATNPVTKPPKKKNNTPTVLTRLKSIVIEGIAVQDIKILELRVFCRNNKIPTVKQERSRRKHYVTYFHIMIFS